MSEKTEQKTYRSAMPLVRDMPESDRPREKMLARGAAALSNTELLAVLIASGSGRDSALSLAAKVLATEKGSLAALSTCQPEDHMRVPGIGTAKACVITAALELGRRAATMPAQPRPAIRSPKEAADLFMGEMRYLKKEVMEVAALNVKSELIMKERIAVGGLNTTVTKPREVFAGAIRKGAYGVILAHNHPSGDPTPSGEDVSITKQLIKAGEILGIVLIDHIVIGDGCYVSFADRDLL
jgi:DNA repair protein RadC